MFHRIHSPLFSKLPLICYCLSRLSFIIYPNKHQSRLYILDSATQFHSLYVIAIMLFIYFFFLLFLEIVFQQMSTIVAPAMDGKTRSCLKPKSTKRNLTWTRILPRKRKSPISFSGLNVAINEKFLTENRMIMSLTNTTLTATRCQSELWHHWTSCL